MMFSDLRAYKTVNFANRELLDLVFSGQREFSNQPEKNEKLKIKIGDEYNCEQKQSIQNALNVC